MIVYALTSPTGKIYIGQTIQGLDKRWRQHVKYAKAGRRSKLYTSMRKYDPKLWSVEVLAECSSVAEMNIMEILAIQMFGDLNLDAGGRGGGPRSPETIDRLREAATGRKASDGTRARMSASASGKSRSDEHQARLTASMTGYKHTEEAKRNMSEAHVGNKHTEESKRKIGEASKGNRHRVGSTNSAESNRKRSESMRGFKHTDETRAKVSAAKKKYWAARRREV